MRLRSKVERFIRNADDPVFVTSDFLNLSDRDQVTRVLRLLAEEKKIVVLGKGIYGRAFVSGLTGEPILDCPDGLLGAARLAFDKLGIDYEDSDAVKNYNTGQSTQIPVNPLLKVKGRCSRKISFDGQELQLA